MAIIDPANALILIWVHVNRSAIRHFASQVFVILRPATLSFYIRPPSSESKNLPEKRHLSRKTAATILYIPSYFSATLLPLLLVRTLTFPFPRFLANLLTRPSLIPYNMLNFISHGLIRRLGRLLSGPVPSLLVLRSTLRHMLSLEMDSIAGVMVSLWNRTVYLQIHQSFDSRKRTTP